MRSEVHAHFQHLGAVLANISWSRTPINTENVNDTILWANPMKLRAYQKYRNKNYILQFVLRHLFNSLP